MFDNFIAEIAETSQDLFEGFYASLPGEVIDEAFVIEDEELWRRFDADACLDQMETRWSMPRLPPEYGRFPRARQGQWLWDLATYLNTRALEEGWWQEGQWYHVWYNGVPMLIHMDVHDIKGATGEVRRRGFKATEVYPRRPGK